MSLQIAMPTAIFDSLWWESEEDVLRGMQPKHTV
jgi:hypothetical protein